MAKSTETTATPTNESAANSELVRRIAAGPKPDLVIKEIGISPARAWGLHEIQGAEGNMSEGQLQRPEPARVVYRNDRFAVTISHEGEPPLRSVETVDLQTGEVRTIGYFNDDDAFVDAVDMFAPEWTSTQAKGAA